MFGQVNEVMETESSRRRSENISIPVSSNLLQKTICLPALKKATAPIFPICSIPLSTERIKP